jgi:hypothetical protein
LKLVKLFNEKFTYRNALFGFQPPAHKAIATRRNGAHERYDFLVRGAMMQNVDPGGEGVKLRGRGEAAQR